MEGLLANNTLNYGCNLETRSNIVYSQIVTFNYFMNSSTLYLNWYVFGVKQRRKGNVLFGNAVNTFYFTLIWRWTYRKGPLKKLERKPVAATTEATLFRLTERVLLYTSSHRQDSTYYCLCYTSRGALNGTRDRSMDPLWEINPTTHRTMRRRSTTELHLASWW